jgi:hypothetical protein
MLYIIDERAMIIQTTKPLCPLLIFIDYYSCKNPIFLTSLHKIDYEAEFQNVLHKILKS